MRVARIRLENFRNHKSSMIELDRLNIFCGPNASGKSSIRQALEICLTGRCEATDRGGRGADDLIRVGARAATIAVELEPLGGIARTISPSGSQLQVADWEGSLKTQQELLYRELGADADLVSAIFNVSAFLSLPPKEQAAMLYRLLPDKEDLLSGLDGELREVLISVVGEPPESLTAEQFEAIYKRLYEARRGAKKELDQAKGRLAGLKEAALADTVRSPRELRDQLRDMASRRALLEARVAEAKAASERKRNLEDQVGTLEAELEEMKARLGELPAPDQEAGARLEAAIASLDKAQAHSTEVATEIRAIDAALAALKKSRGKCPLAPDVIPCPLQGDGLKRLTANLDGKRKILVAEHEKAQKEMGRLTSQANELSKALGATEEVEALEEEIERVKRELADAKGELARLPEQTSAENGEIEITEIEKQIGRVQSLLAEAELAERNHKAVEEAKGEVERLGRRVEALEKLVSLFGPGPEGLRSRQLSRRLEAVEERINNNLEVITDGEYQVSLEAEPDFRLVVHGPAGTVDLRQLSTSERLRVGIAVSEALAHLSGLKVLVIDDAEILDRRNRALISNFLKRLQNAYNTILLITTMDREDLRAPDAPGIATFWVEGGRVERVKGGGGK